MERARFSRLFMSGLALLAFAAQAADPVYIPDELKTWRDWVLADEEFRKCPFIAGVSNAVKTREQHICAWAGRLVLETDATGARFEQTWRVYADEWVDLPGSNQVAWPIEVSVNDDPALVVSRQNKPQVRLKPGEYRITGRFVWDRRPSTLPLPAQTGLLDLSIAGKRVAQPERSSASVWLGERRPSEQTRETTTIEVARRIDDGQPITLTTLVTLDVSGPSREERIGRPLPEGFAPTSLAGELAARLDADGHLRVQVRPGKWQLTLKARAPASLDRIVLGDPGGPWAQEEIWGYNSNDRLRVTSARGLPAVDPTQVSTPWQDLPSFRVLPGETLELVERSRGLSQRNANQLHLARELWYDFDNRGFTAKDLITGRMHQGWRLDMRAPYALESAKVADGNLLITEGIDNNMTTGVEVRAPALSLEAVSRLIPAGPQLPVSGWSQRLDGVDTRLILPPGNRLFAALGPDRAADAWVNQWRLLDFFLVLVVTVAAWKLLGRVWGMVALLALAISYHEPGAPIWVWLNVLIALALARVAPLGLLKTIAVWYQRASFALVVALLVPFIANQLHLTLHPQLESHRQASASVRGGQGTFAKQAPASTEVNAEAMANKPPARAAADERKAVQGAILGSRADKSDVFARFAPNALVQAGPGLPAWDWRSYRLSWSGPVDAEQSMRLLIMPRWLVRLLRVAAVALAALFAYALARGVFTRLRLPGLTRAAASGGTLTGALALIAGLMLTQWPAPASADIPTAELLGELKRRLTAAPECTPNCATILSAEIVVSTESLLIDLEINALAGIAIPLPGSLKTWEPSRIRVAGETRDATFRDDKQTLWLELTPGRHRVQLGGDIPSVDTLNVPFALPPQRVSVSANGWEVAGVRDARLSAGSLELVRVKSEQAQTRFDSNRFPRFVRVIRRLSFNLDWELHTEVQRISPENGAFAVTIPLVSGESVLSEAVEVGDNGVKVAFGARAASVSWHSSLQRTEALELVAPSAGVAWVEVWQLAVSPIWRVDYAGVPAVMPAQIDPAFWIPEFYPLPDESLALRIARPAASAGSTLALDRVNLVNDIGARSTQSTLSVNYRSTRGGQHVITLPAAAELLEVKSDGRTLPVNVTGGKLSLPVVPGAHSWQLRWRSPTPNATRYDIPSVDLGAPASNVDLRMNVPADRWVLFTRGPLLGPAVLYWAELLALALAALVLGRFRLTPLRSWHWLLLGLGFSTFAWPMVALLAAWLFALGWRERWSGSDKPLVFNTVQIALGGLTVIALLLLLVTIPFGLLGRPDMHIDGNGSSARSLHWFADQVAQTLPAGSAWSLPMWLYKAAILVWALWLSLALVRWLPWAWRCLGKGGWWRGSVIAPPAGPAEQS